MLDTRLVEAISDVFGLPSNEVTADLSRDAIAGWDSIGHLKLILRLEEAFRIRFPMAAIPKLVSVARIQETLDRLQAS